MQVDEEGFSRLAESRGGRTGYEFNRATFHLFTELDELATKGGITPLASKSQEYVDEALKRGGTTFTDPKDGAPMLRVHAAGRPIYRKVEYVAIQTPGDKTNVIDRPATEDDKRNYAKQYQAFKANSSQDEASGTMLSAWGMVDPARVEEYVFFGVRTVEQLAGMSDGNLQRMGPGAMNDRTRAQDYIKLMAGHAPVVELRTENERMSGELEVLKRQVLEMGAALQEHRRTQAVDRLTATVSPEAASIMATDLPDPSGDKQRRLRK